MITPCYTNFYTCIHPIPSQHITSNSHNLGRRSMSHLRKCQYPVLTTLFGGGGGGSRQPQITGYEGALVATIEPQSMHSIDDLPPWTLALLHARNILRAEEPARHNGLHFSLSSVSHFLLLKCKQEKLCSLFVQCDLAPALRSPLVRGSSKRFFHLLRFHCVHRLNSSRAARSKISECNQPPRFRNHHKMDRNLMKSSSDLAKCWERSKPNDGPGARSLLLLAWGPLGSTILTNGDWKGGQITSNLLVYVYILLTTHVVHVQAFYIYCLVSE